MLQCCGEATRFPQRRLARITFKLGVDQRSADADHDQHHQHFDQGEARVRFALHDYSIEPAPHKSHDPISLSKPVPPGCPSAPKLNTSMSACKPGLRY